MLLVMNPQSSVNWTVTENMISVFLEVISDRLRTRPTAVFICLTTFIKVLCNDLNQKRLMREVVNKEDITIGLAQTIILFNLYSASELLFMHETNSITDLINRQIKTNNGDIIIYKKSPERSHTTVLFTTAERKRN